MKRLITLKGKAPNFETEINRLIKEELYRVLDILFLDWDKMDRTFTLALVIQEEEKFFRQNCVVFETKKLADLGKDLDDFSEVMSNAKNVPYQIQLIRVFKVSLPRGDLYCAYIIFED